MADVYVECLVRAKSSMGAKFLRLLFAMLAAALLVLSLWGTLFFLGALIMFGGFVLMKRFTEIEYDYLYVDRELTIDKVMAKSKRKRVASYTIDRMEILAPYKSHRLDEYKNRKPKTVDYSIGEELMPDLRYVAYFEGNVRMILSPSESMVQAIRNIAPRKVVTY
ncbi:MAG: DUF6106 family protein [Lachnospiraceae bacterium]|nr:DUF6106 family protein [Lachnospiraceae bacterium]